MKKLYFAHYRRVGRKEYLQADRNTPSYKKQIKDKEFSLNNPNPLLLLEPFYRKNYELLLKHYYLNQKFSKR